MIKKKNKKQTWMMQKPYHKQNTYEKVEHSLGLHY